MRRRQGGKIVIDREDAIALAKHFEITQEELEQ